ncbi:hypothetical protein N481_16380 [Pseudoalteromonas luteoviolacea S4047-1]|uniref:Uncharacterized protein n=1 Tax=Pseudoalteromonas luteoviolacea S4054 TaxID=1129367 RepID=A0A0F6AHH1_9GAMM|nr:hypothetical protein N479_25650 [Pseudoalteromonas luteoviolacea S4054]KZN71987.1 hypothetical protein N481_16380 [Pseudoalteromonas luteoviolacea S4047-1]
MKIKKVMICTAVALLIGSLGIYASMEGYQKENMLKIINQMLS